ncbi:PD-(D/E)XK nuclease family transposase [Pedobacter heparinus]|uniref:PD-(D/E)XK nuclease family transposase n=1 Tax=Pedobacter heparinus TaxID=984 RepID=UPI00292F7277|nr:PD-(D/E)XK nuclease family transposase [Pedobacter heparinus]
MTPARFFTKEWAISSWTAEGSYQAKKQYIKTDKLPNFDKKESELVTELDKWFYLLKNLSHLDKIPDFLDKRVFQKIFKIAEMSKMTKEERELYHSDVKAKSDWNAGIRYAEKKAKEEGIEEGEHIKAIEIALKMKMKGTSNEDIAELTGLAIQEIEKL